MNTLDANRAEPRYTLESELARRSIHAIESDADRELAWVNSVCILFLLIGIAGFKPASTRIRPPPPLEEASAALVEPLPAPPQPASEPQESETSDNAEPPDSPPVVAVTPPAPNISFSVPTIGNLVVPTALAKAPPLAPLKPVVALRSRPTQLNSTGGGGERPQPPYPKIALEQGQQGAVTLQMTVDEAGLIKNIQIVQSSGFSVLDRNALEFVRRRWSVPPGKGSAIYEATINYKLELN